MGNATKLKGVVFLHSEGLIILRSTHIYRLAERHIQVSHSFQNLFPSSSSTRNLVGPAEWRWNNKS
jgi:hypothetical protein